ncbi:MAG: ACT domain-containing protein [Thiolinea sp.]
MKLNLSILDEQFTVHRFKPNTKIPEQILAGEFFSISRTQDELSIVCSSQLQLASDKAETDWSCIKVLGPLDFSLTGILAKISGVLAEAKISIFALSTFDTDYILVKTEKLEAAKKVLEKAGYSFKG